MKNLIILINLTIIIGIAAIFTGPASEPGDAKRNEKGIASASAELRTTRGSDFTTLSSNPATASKSDEFVARFIAEMAEARMMDLEEGKIAQQKSTTRDLKSYGTLMVNDQTEMLRELKKLAALKDVTLPSELGNDKADGLQDLRDVHGKDFDKKFVKMMIIDHKRDVKKFEQATRSSDADVQVFATKYLPYIQSHLEKIRSLK
jgi:putative membrane protein